MYEERLAAAHARYAHKRPRSADLFERARAAMSGGSTRSVLDMRPFPFRVDLDDTDPVLMDLVFHALVDRGCYLAPRGYIALSAVITDDDCDTFVAALAQSLDATAG